MSLIVSMLALNICLLYYIVHLLTKRLEKVEDGLDTCRRRLNQQGIMHTLLAIEVWPEHRTRLVFTLPEDLQRRLADPEQGPVTVH